MTRKSRAYITTISLCLMVFSTFLFIKPNLKNTILRKNTPGTAHSYVPMDLSKLRDESDVIIRGRAKESLPSYKGKIACIIDEIGDEVGYSAGSRGKHTKRDLTWYSWCEIRKRLIKLPQDMKREAGLIYTDKVIQVSKYYKNNLGLGEIVIREPGGIVNNEVVQGASKTPLNSGDEVILFLKRLNPNKYIILTGPQGTYHVRGENRSK